MRHHFADFLDRSGDYWSIVPNRERWRYHFADLADAPPDTEILTLTRKDQNWERVSELESLRELTLHEPSQDQFQHLKQMSGLLSLRISHARPRNLVALEGLHNLRELVLEYVSGFDDLGPVGMLPQLRSLYMENLRRVRDFSGLGHSQSLRYVSIDGTVDWRQPVRSLEFLTNIQTLEHLRIAHVNLLSEHPVFDPLIELEHLKEVNISMGAVPLSEFAFLQAKRPDAKGAVRSAYWLIEAKREPISQRDYRSRIPESEFRELSSHHIDENGNRFMDIPTTAYLLGKGERTRIGSEQAVRKACEEHARKYEELVAKYS